MVEEQVLEFLDCRRKDLRKIFYEIEPILRFVLEKVIVRVIEKNCEIVKRDSFDSIETIRKQLIDKNKSDEDKLFALYFVKFQKKQISILLDFKHSISHNPHINIYVKNSDIDVISQFYEKITDELNEIKGQVFKGDGSLFETNEKYSFNDIVLLEETKK